ncbi:MAG: HEAT repeat domain-containing protein [Thermodesulfovibrionales bacterium]|nr:HEAT repeat domain-containing protein [Thermodesulfovibrionales bacterium]
MDSNTPQNGSKLPLDAKLLSEAVIELNISRRSVSLYPKDHPITKESLNRAHNFMKKLFELRHEITLGIAKDNLIVDEYTLDRRNPVFKEFGRSLHEKGIAAVTFQSGLSIDELYIFHELITKEELQGQELIESAKRRGLRHIIISPLDISKLQFLEGHLREGGIGTRVLEDYVSGLLEGRLADADAEGIILMTPPDEIADILNENLREDAPEETYERVITAYLRKKGERIRSDLFSKFLSLIENLNPELKKQFLKKSFSIKRLDEAEMEQIIKELTPEDLDRIMRIFEEQVSFIPETLRNLMNKLYETKGETKLLEMIIGNKKVVHDLELDERTVMLFSEDHFDTYVPEDYIVELDAMLRGFEGKKTALSEEAIRVCDEVYTEKVISEIMIELLASGTANRDEFLQLLTRLSGYVQSFLDTGRFSEILEVYNAVYSSSLTGPFREEAASMIEYFFRSEQFISRLIESFRLWGRLNREGVIKLATVLRHYLIKPFIEQAIKEQDQVTKKFYLSILSRLGSEVADEAYLRLENKNPEVLRDMIYLIRECGGKRYLKTIRNLARHEDRYVALEAVKTLLHFRTPDAVSHLKLYLRSDNPDIRDMAVKLAGSYKIKEAVPYLLELLEKKDILGTESYYKISVVNALAEIGDPKAIPVLKKIYNSKTLLFWSNLDELKLEIFRTIHKYPLESVKELLEMGLDSKNKEIASISRRLLEGVRQDG